MMKHTLLLESLLTVWRGYQTLTEKVQGPAAADHQHWIRDWVYPSDLLTLPDKGIILVGNESVQGWVFMPEDQDKSGMLKLDTEYPTLHLGRRSELKDMRFAGSVDEEVLVIASGHMRHRFTPRPSTKVITNFDCPGGRITASRMYWVWITDKYHLIIETEAGHRLTYVGSSEAS